MKKLPFAPQEVLDSLFDGVYCLDRDRRILYWNHAAEELTGYTSDEVVGRNCASSLLAHTDADGRHLCRTACPMVATMRDGLGRETRVFLRHRDGHRIPVRIRSTPIRNEQGTIVGGVEVFANDTPSVALEERVSELERLSLLDPLTSLPNRRFAEQQLETKHGEWERYGWPYGVLMVDVDYFKRINDTWGHDAGDRALEALAKTLTAKTRVSDLVSRWGGEEFLIIGRCSTAEQLTAMGESVRGLVSATRYRADAVTTEGLTVSVGGALVERSDRPADVMKRADEALYAAKRSGRNRFVYCGTPDLRRAVG